MSNLAEIHARALDAAAASDRKNGPYRAQIVPHETPAWHIVKTAPGAENKAADYLAHRGIGIFLPKFVAGARLVRPNGVVEDLSNKLIIHGRVFVWVWDILAHWRRIMGCPGVIRIVCDGNAKPVVVPDQEIRSLIARQYKQAIAQPKRRKRYRSSNDSITITSADHLHVDGNHRNRVLDVVADATLSAAYSSVACSG